MYPSPFVLLCSLTRLKIKRSDVHFGYRTVGGSARVYKIELNGEMRAAKVGLRLPLCRWQSTTYQHFFGCWYTRDM